jgi:hypothetical protein
MFVQNAKVSSAHLGLRHVAADASFSINLILPTWNPLMGFARLRTRKTAVSRVSARSRYHGSYTGYTTYEQYLGGYIHPSTGGS